MYPYKVAYMNTRSTYSHAVNVDSEASIFSTGGYWPYISTLVDSDAFPFPSVFSSFIFKDNIMYYIGYRI